MKKVQLKWLAYCHGYNDKEIETINVFEYSRVSDAIERNLKKLKANIITKDEFFKEVRGWLMNQFWGRFEYETIVTTYPQRENSPERKIDVFEQVDMNWDGFVAYLEKQLGI